MSHYNTTNETGSDLQLLRGKARKQEESILALFKTMPTTEMSAWHVERYTSYPITSVRRAITDLSQAGKLTCTGRKHIGPYGRSCYTWRLSK